MEGKRPLAGLTRLLIPSISDVLSCPANLNTQVWDGSPSNRPVHSQPGDTTTSKIEAAAAACLIDWAIGPSNARFCTCLPDVQPRVAPEPDA